MIESKKYPLKKHIKSHTLDLKGSFMQLCCCHAVENYCFSDFCFVLFCFGCYIIFCVAAYVSKLKQSRLCDFVSPDEFDQNQTKKNILWTEIIIYLCYKYFIVYLQTLYFLQFASLRVQQKKHRPFKIYKFYVSQGKKSCFDKFEVKKKYATVF
jgi:hypothetical protein